MDTTGSWMIRVPAKATKESDTRTIVAGVPKRWAASGAVQPTVMAQQTKMRVRMTAPAEARTATRWSNVRRPNAIAYPIAARLSRGAAHLAAT